MSSKVIVMFQKGTTADIVEAAAQKIMANGGSIGHRYSTTIIGFSADLPDSLIEEFANDVHVESIEPDGEVSINFKPKILDSTIDSSEPSSGKLEISEAESWLPLPHAHLHLDPYTKAGIAFEICEGTDVIQSLGRGCKVWVPVRLSLTYFLPPKRPSMHVDGGGWMDPYLPVSVVGRNGKLGFVRKAPVFTHFEMTQDYLLIGPFDSPNEANDYANSVQASIKGSLWTATGQIVYFAHARRWLTVDEVKPWRHTQGDIFTNRGTTWILFVGGSSIETNETDVEPGRRTKTPNFIECMCSIV